MWSRMTKNYQSADIIITEVITMLEFIFSFIFVTVFITAFSGAMLIVIDRQKEWDAKHKK